tara:strand:- start:827 stop:1036 length:210 start_codon:yes stop_codon:yes gene_type:complete
MFEITLPRNEILIAIIVGIASGFIVVSAQYIAEVFGQKYNPPLIGSIMIILAIIIILFASKWKIKKEDE